MCSTMQPMTSPTGGRPTPVTAAAPGTSSSDVRTPSAWNRAIRAAAAGGRPPPLHWPSPSGMSPAPSSGSWTCRARHGCLPIRAPRRQAEPMRIVLIGPPGSGKGTQAALLADRLGIPAVSTGELFRAHVDSGTELGRQVAAFTTRGDLVPDDLTVAVVAERPRARHPPGGGGGGAPRPPGLRGGPPARRLPAHERPGRAPPRRAGPPR